MDLQVTEVAPGVHHARAKHVSWTLLTEGDEVTVIDTGYPGDRARLVASLDCIGRSTSDVAAVLLTHGHPDHQGSAEHLRTAAGVPVWVHPEEVANTRGEKIEQVGEATLVRHAWQPRVVHWALDIVRLGATKVDRVQELRTFTEQTLDVPGRPHVIPTPGHTSGHCCFHLPERGALVAGDALMTEHAVTRGVGPRLLPDFFNSDTDQARASLARLRELEAEVVVPGHGPAFRGSPSEAVELALAQR